MVHNIMTVDLEDYYVSTPFDMWDNYESRVEKSSKIILKLFEKYNIKATFFTVGKIAERHPKLIEEISSKGHEIASHSYSHTDIRTMSKEKFELDLKKSIQILENLSGQKILGFRAPYFSIDKSNFWAFQIIQKYLKYDSSVFPVRTPLYGLPSAPRSVYYMDKNNPLLHDSNSNFLELPLATWKFPGIGNIPIAGGFYLRFLPLWVIKHGIQKLNSKNISATIYIHPHDLDPKKPRIPGSNWRGYWGLKHSKRKFENLLKSFKFSSIQDTFFK